MLETVRGHRKCDRYVVRVAEGRQQVSTHCCAGSSGTKCSEIVMTVVTT
jgi:hypothetical protein